MTTPKLLITAPLVMSISLACAGHALAASPSGAYAASPEVSDNWAGYAVTAARPFSRVVGAWVQPHATCAGASRGYSAFWIGIGGFTRDAHALEQIGTEADCAGARASSYAWYELLPASEVTLKLKVHAGDRMAASVTVRDHEVTLHLRDLSTGDSFAKVVRMASPDTSSAEWIAEAPSVCANGDQLCDTLPLADFSTVSFDGATAAIREGSPRTIDSPAFDLTEVALQSHGVGFGRFGRAIASSSPAQATPGTLASSGSAFTVTWEPATASPPGSSPWESRFSEAPGVSSAERPMSALEPGP
jgi:Peptidase A4 family